MTDAAPQLHYIPYESFLADITAVAHKITRGDWRPDFVIGIGRGGLGPGVWLSHRLDLPMLSVDHSAKVPGFADELLAKLAGMSTQGTRLLFLDDINDSGGTIAYIRELLASHGADETHLRFAVLLNNTRSRATVDYWSQAIDRDEDKRWFVFPWEAVGATETIVDEALSVPERLA